MSTTRTLAVCGLIFGVTGNFARADALLTSGGSGDWTYWNSGAQVTLAQEPAPTPAPPPSPTPPASTSPSSTFSGGGADAFINLGSGPFPEEGLLTSGGAQPWYTSPVVTKFFGGQQPDAQQQADFANSVLQNVQQTFQQSGGLAPRLTLDPSVPANHTLSVVSGTTYGPNPNVIGIADVGLDGVGFIDKLPYAQTLDELKMAVAHNVAHELMHTFGIAGHNDTTGQYLDAASAGWSKLIDPNATFSPETVRELQDGHFAPDRSGGTSSQLIDGEFEILPQPVPEPATYALWVLASAAVVLQRRRSTRRSPRPAA